MATKSEQSPWALARRQHEILTREELLALGFTTAAIKHRLERGRLHRTPWRGVYAVGHPNLTRLGLPMAGVKAWGRGACLSHTSAAELWGARRRARGPIPVSAPGQRQRDGICLRRRSGI